MDRFGQRALVVALAAFAAGVVIAVSAAVAGRLWAVEPRGAAEIASA